MALSWNEIKDRAISFAKTWESTINEEADAKPFLDAFFEVFGIDRKRHAAFEYRVKKLNEADGYIDLLWKGVILVEMKSRGKNLDKAFAQAKEYVHGLKDYELPKYILVSDFETFRVFDTEENTTSEFKLNELYNKVHLFGLIAGYIKREYKEQDPVNVKAAELMGKLHDRLKDIGYEGHPLEVYLVRLLFCLFAEDTTIFTKCQFEYYIKDKTNVDGSDLAPKIQELFQVLNTADNKRFKNLDEQLNAFPYVNGKLFDKPLQMASFDKKMRETLLECCYLDWSKISPAIFGAMFQSVMNPKERRDLGAHYTSEKNIMKLIKPLFLDALWAELATIKNNQNKLTAFHDKLSKLRFLDPACGCGNFLIITYRELRLLELEVLEKIQKGQQVVDLSSLILLNVDQFYGIEYDEFPARIAEVAMWLIDHQMNMTFAVKFGQPFARLPLTKSATIVHGSAFNIKWEDLTQVKEKRYDFIVDELIYTVQEPTAIYHAKNVLTNKITEVKPAASKPTPKANTRKHFDYIIGNPPFLGSRVMSTIQKQELTTVFDNAKNVGELDYVTAWYMKAAKLIQGTDTKVAFVSTNSVVQGLHTSILWGNLIAKYGIKIHFAHRSFKWKNEAKGNAAVYCVIVGFANFDSANKSIFEYKDINGEAHELKVKTINPYLIDAKDVFVDKKSTPICSNIPEMNFGNMPADGGEFLFTTEEKNMFLEKEPEAKKYFKPFISAYEFINNEKRWCLWLQDIDPSEQLKLKLINERVKNVRLLREKSSRPQLAKTPTLFAQITQPKGADFLVIPRVSSENRTYIPIGFFDKKNIASDTCLIIPNATVFHFGILTSLMHMTWVKTVCGRLKSDYRYSKDIVYNNFPWPENCTDKQIKTIEEKAQKVLDVRQEFSKASLATLYSLNGMPPALVKAHDQLNKAVDAAYRAQPFASEVARLEFLFELYEKYTANLFTNSKIKKTKNNPK